jgi:hypothetical protein
MKSKGEQWSLTLNVIIAIQKPSPVRESFAAKQEKKEKRMTHCIFLAFERLLNMWKILINKDNNMGLIHRDFCQ